MEFHRVSQLLRDSRVGPDAPEGKAAPPGMVMTPNAFRAIVGAMMGRFGQARNVAVTIHFDWSASQIVTEFRCARTNRPLASSDELYALLRTP